MPVGPPVALNGFRRANFLERALFVQEKALRVKGEDTRCKNG